MKTLYLMQGISASGKSTVANMIHEYEDNVLDRYGEIASTDDLWYDEFGKYNFDITKLSEKHKENQEFVRQLMLSPNVEYVIIDNTNMTNKEAQPYLNLAKEFNYEVRVISVSCSLENSKKYNSQRNEDRKVPEEVIDNQNKRFERINLE